MKTNGQLQGNTTAVSNPMKTPLPNMHVDGFGATLQKYAAAVRADQTIVEVGSWLGGGTYHLALASGPQPLHVYDKWTANQSEVDKAIARGEDGLKVGQSFKHIVARNLSGFGDRIHLHQIDDVRRAHYDHSWGKIGLYVDDASKNNFQEVIDRFAKFLAPGGIAILMDYAWKPCFKQREVVAEMGWELIDDDTEDHNACVFRIT